MPQSLMKTKRTPQQFLDKCCIIIILYLLFVSFTKTTRPLSVQMGVLIVFKGCYNVKNEYFIDSEIMLIISLRRWEIFLLAVI